MKRLFKILFPAAFTFCILSLNAFAAGYNRINYGALIGDPVTYDAAQVIAHNTTVHNNGGYTYEKSSLDSHSGEYSGRIDYASGVGEFLLENIDSGGMKYQSIMKYNPIYAEMYVKGADFSKGTVFPYLSFKNAEGKDVGGRAEWSFDEPDENGWVRCWTYWHVYEDYTNVNFMFCIQKGDANDYSMGDIFVDDMRLILIPQTVEFNDMAAENSRFDLNNIKPCGKDINGDKTEIYTKDLIKYEVISGDAYIDSRGVVAAKNPGRVQLRADFFGKTDNFYIDFPVGEVYADDIVLNGEKCTVTVTNSSADALNIRLQTVLTDGGKFIKAIKTDKAFAAGESAELVQEIGTPPFYVKNPEYKSCILAEKNGAWVPVEK